MNPLIKPFGAVLLAAIILFSTLSTAEASVDFSKEMRSMINQAENAYLKPMGGDFVNALDNVPDIFAIVLGATLRHQEDYLARNPQYKPQYKNLHKQCKTFLYQVAAEHEYKHPRSGEPLTERVMDERFHHGFSGASDSIFKDGFGINANTISLPLMLAEVPVQNNVQDLAAFHQKPQVNQNAVTILGQGIAAAEKLGPEFEQGEFPADIVVGAWRSALRKYGKLFWMVSRKLKGGRLGAITKNIETIKVQFIKQTIKAHIKVLLL